MKIKLGQKVKVVWSLDRVVVQEIEIDESYFEPCVTDPISDLIYNAELDLCKRDRIVALVTSVGGDMNFMHIEIDREQYQEYELELERSEDADRLQ